MTAPDLTLECPWCGPMNGHYGYTVTRFGTRLTCFCCDSHGPRAPTQDEAKAAWNNRAPLAEALAVIDALKAEFEEGGSPTAAKVLDLARERIAALRAIGERAE